MTELDKKERLAIALIKERDTLPEYSAFGDKNDLSIYDDTIAYLRTGEYPFNYEDNDILLACIEDLDTMLSDYGIE